MEVVRAGKATRRAAADSCTGAAWLDEIAGGRPSSRVQVLTARFEPGARTTWHRHPLGQVIQVLEGEGRAQVAGGPLDVIRPGDTVRFSPGARHWHGAAPHRFMAHLAIQEADAAGVHMTCEDQVTDREYTAASRILTPMETTRTRKATRRGPAESFTGTVWVDDIAANPPPSRVSAGVVHFEPGARTAWHRHPLGQVIHVLEGEGRAQAESGPVETIRAGDTVRFLPGERHWHGAAPHRFMTHVAIHESDDHGVHVAWEEHVTDDEYTSGG